VIKEPVFGVKNINSARSCGTLKTNKNNFAKF
jgi:hypothetical protein